MGNKINFIERVKRAIFNVEKYNDFALEKTQIAVKYFLKLILVLIIIISIASVYKFGAMGEFFIDVFREDFPEFSYKDNTLLADDVVSIVRENKKMQLFVIVDTEIENESSKINEYITEMTKYKNSVMFLRDKVYLQIEGISGQVAYTYEQLNVNSLGELTKQSLEETLDKTNMIAIYSAFFITIAFYLFLIYIATTTLEIIVIALLGYLTSKIVRVNIKIFQAFNMAVYAITLSILLTAIYLPIRLLTGFNLEYFSLMYTIIPYIYIVTAVLLIRSDLIKQQIEIGKIQAVQKVVRQELDEEKEREKEKEKEKEKQKKEEKKKEKKENGEEPEGSEA